MNTHTFRPAKRPDLGRPGEIPKGPSVAFFIRRSRALADPHRILGVFREIVERWGPVTSSRSGLLRRSYIVADRTVADRVFRLHEAFAKYPHPTSDLAKLQALIGKGMLATHSDESWSRHRRSVANVFSKGATQAKFGAIVVRNTNEVMEGAAREGAHLSNISELAMRLSGRVMSDILAPNHPFADQNFLEIKRLLDISILEFHRWDFKRRARPYRAALREQAVMLVNTAAGQNADGGLLQRMMEDEPEWQTNAAARERLLDRTINLVVAGYETTATTLNWVVYLLSSSPDVQEALREQIDKDVYGDGTAAAAFDSTMLLRRVIWEAMRLYSVLWFNVRYVTNDITIENYRFVKNSRVMLLPFLINRSAAWYCEPYEFQPDRYLRGEVEPLFPFGNGQRVCIGRTLAELEMQAFVVGLLRRFKLEATCTPGPLGGVLLQPDRDMIVKLTPLSA